LCEVNEQITVVTYNVDCYCWSETGGFTLVSSQHSQYTLTGGESQVVETSS